LQTDKIDKLSHWQLKPKVWSYFRRAPRR